MTDTRSIFLELKADVGVTADGNLEPLVAIGLAIPVPQMIPNPATKELEPGESVENVTVEPSEALERGALARIVPGTRMVEVVNERIAANLLATLNWEQVDRPTTRAVQSAARQLSDAAEEAGTHTDQPGDGQED